MWAPQADSGEMHVAAWGIEDLIIGFVPTYMSACCNLSESNGPPGLLVPGELVQQLIFFQKKTVN